MSDNAPEGAFTNGLEGYRAMNTPIVTFHADGRVTFAEHLQPTEAAREAWEHLLKLAAEHNACAEAALSDPRVKALVEAAKIALQQLIDHGSDGYASGLDAALRDMEGEG